MILFNVIGNLEITQLAKALMHAKQLGSA